MPTTIPPGNWQDWIDNGQWVEDDIVTGDRERRVGDPYLCSSPEVAAWRENEELDALFRVDLSPGETYAVMEYGNKLPGESYAVLD